MSSIKPTPPPPPPALKRTSFALAAALVASMMASPVMAAGAFGDAACRPEAEDNRVTRWTSEIHRNGFSVTSRAVTHNTVQLGGSIAKPDQFGNGFDYTPPLPDDPQFIHFAVMGNDSKAGTVVLGGRRIGDLDAVEFGLSFDSSNARVSGLKPNTHYVAVFYSPYLGFGNLNPFVRYCFRTDRDPDNPWGGSGTGCFAPYTPTVDGPRMPANYALCAAARTACNDAADTTWEAAGNRCIAASN